MIKFSIEKCRDKGGISVKPLKNIRLNLAKISAKFKVIMKTPILVIIEENGQIIVRDYGELLFKELKDKPKIRKIAEKIYEAGL